MTIKEEFVAEWVVETQAFDPVSQQGRRVTLENRDPRLEVLPAHVYPQSRASRLETIVRPIFLLLSDVAGFRRRRRFRLQYQRILFPVDRAKRRM